MSPAARDILASETACVEFFYEDITDTWSAALTCETPMLALDTPLFPLPQDALADLLERLEVLVGGS